jgi:hypothetical protein
MLTFQVLDAPEAETEKTAEGCENGCEDKRHAWHKRDLRVNEKDKAVMKKKEVHFASEADN